MRRAVTPRYLRTSRQISRFVKLRGLKEIAPAGPMPTAGPGRRRPGAAPGRPGRFTLQFSTCYDPYIDKSNSFAVFEPGRASASEHWYRDRARQHPAMRSEQMNAPWVRSSFSFANGNCVEVAELPGDSVGIRDSRDPGGPVLSFTRAEWAAFLASQVATCRSCRTPRS